MRKLLATTMLGGALLLGACGGTPTTVNDAANQAGTAVSDPTAGSLANDAATAVSDPSTATDVSGALNEAGTALADPTNAAMINEAATAVTGPEVATAVTDAAGALTAAASDVTLAQGQALVLDATKSAGDIKDYKWTITKAPAGAESVVGQVIKENSYGNVSIDPADYGKYFPQAGTYTVQLAVTDNAGKTATDDFDVMVP
ncbi:hypothetical protein SE17_19075 [Kouleothrix aurantiaca]|uniref:PKD domain-containing protein n=1 Tax=Kouleothrix aurantiaca TaxID=186479 RepID=A0A0P9F5N3_9CHLR|nr:hypothetical protein SE17_19075 [Kouleothrix aurantiaca]